MTLSITEAKERVDTLVRTLQRYFQNEHRISVDEVVKGGSLGHGTAVPGDYDLDLVLYSRSIDAEIVAEIGVDLILEKLKTFLSRHFGRDFEFEAKTKHSLQFRFHGDIDVDLLPSPYWESYDKLHRFMEGKTKEVQMQFSCSASKWQVDFFSQQPNEVKEYIKRFKAWRNRRWPKGKDGMGRPKSFLLGLLMIEAYKRSNGELWSIQQELIRMIKDHRNISIRWKDARYDWAYRLKSGEMDELVREGRFTKISSSYGKDVVYDNLQHRQRAYVPAETPSILDCANPFNNVYQSGISNYFRHDPEGTYRPGTGNWTRLVEWIDTFDITEPVEQYC